MDVSQLAEVSMIEFFLIVIDRRSALRKRTLSATC